MRNGALTSLSAHYSVLLDIQRDGITKSAEDEVDMEEKQIIDFLSSHSIVGAGIAAVLAFVYKLWRILKTDRKEDDLDNAERSLRDELRIEVKLLKEEVVKLREQVATLAEHNAQCLDDNAKLKGKVYWLESMYAVCIQNHPDICPHAQHMANILGNQHEHR